MLKCKTCGAESGINNPYRKLKSTMFISSWFNIHNNPPHEIQFTRQDCLKMVIYD